MKILLLTAFFIFTSCANRKPGTSEFAKELKALNLSHSARYAACIQQEEEVLGKAISEVINQKDKDVYYSFPLKEKDALKYLQAFDYSKTDHKSEDEYFQFYLGKCSNENFEDYQEFQLGRRMCSGVFVEYKFFQGLIYGLANYRWSASTKDLARSVLRDYLRNLADEKSYFISLMLGISLVKDMSNHQLVPKKNISAIDRIVHELETKRIELEAEMKIQPPKNCDDETMRYQEERTLGVLAADKLNQLIKENF
jgi:hypothetical protein